MGTATSPPPPDYNNAQIVHQSPPPMHAVQSPPQQYFDPQQQQQQQQQQPFHQAQSVQSPQPTHQYYGNDKGQALQQQSQQVDQQQTQGGPYAIPLHSLGEQPAWVNCPVCRSTQMTRVNYVAGTTTHLWALALCCCLCLGCIPYCVSGLKNAEHHCGQCGAHLATFKRSGGIEVAPGAAGHVAAGQPAPQKN